MNSYNISIGAVEEFQLNQQEYERFKSKQTMFLNKINKKKK